MSTIGFLHTSPVHVPTFDALVAEITPGSPTLSTVDAQLLARARHAGQDDSELAAGVERALVELIERGADVVVCTCSTIGGVAEVVGARRGLAVVRVDRPIVELAIATGRRIGVVAALETTVEPTLALVDEVARDAGRAVDVSVTIVDGAWDRFELGDQEGYIELIAKALPEAAREVDVVVLAQASMAAAADLAQVGVPVLASPRTAVAMLTKRRFA